MRLELLTRQESMSKAVFPKLESLLENEEYVKAIQKFSKIDEYDNPIDFLFVEMFPSWRTGYIEFKENNGPKLISNPSLTKNILKEWDRTLCKCVKTAYKHMSWTNFTKDCKKL